MNHAHFEKKELVPETGVPLRRILSLRRCMRCALNRHTIQWETTCVVDLEKFFIVRDEFLLERLSLPGDALPQQRWRVTRSLCRGGETHSIAGGHILHRLWFHQYRAQYARSVGSTRVYKYKVLPLVLARPRRHARTRVRESIVRKFRVRISS